MSQLQFFEFLAKGILCLVTVVILVANSVNIYAKEFWEFLPDVKKSSLTSKYICVNSQTELFFPESFKKRYFSTYFEFRKELANLNNNCDQVVSIYMKLLSPLDSGYSILKNPEAYVIKFSPQNIEILASSLQGLLYGLTYLEGLILKNKGRLQEGLIKNWPDLKVRALHIGNFWSVIEVKDWIKKARFAHFNILVLSLGKINTNFSALKAFKSEKRKFTIDWFLKIKETISLQDLIDIVEYAKQNGLEFVPEIKFLTHQDRFIADIYPEFLFNRLTYDPQKEELYIEVVFPLLDSIIDLVHPKVIHIGHDEVARRGRSFSRLKLKPWEVSLPAFLFLKDVLTIRNYLSHKGVSVWMWADMLFSPEELPSMKKNHLHGMSDYPKLKIMLPKDIVMCDWHYFDNSKQFLSSLLLANEGFKVIGVTWYEKYTIKSFSKYIAQLPHNGLGMMATTWKGALRKRYKKDVHSSGLELMVQQVIDQIIQQSGNQFWNVNN